jgi:predicted nucleic acid-binding protein
MRRGVKPVALLDTNVWVSALLNPEGAPARVVDAWREGAIDVVGQGLLP